MSQVENKEIKTILSAKELKSIANKKYYLKHKARHSGAVDCVMCGGKYSYYGKARHLKSKRHMFCVQLINSKN